MPSLRLERGALPDEGLVHRVATVGRALWGESHDDDDFYEQVEEQLPVSTMVIGLAGIPLASGSGVASEAQRTRVRYAGPFADGAVVVGPRTLDLYARMLMERLDGRQHDELVHWRRARLTIPTTRSAWVRCDGEVLQRSSGDPGAVERALLGRDERRPLTSPCSCGSGTPGPDGAL